ncbi:MAG TPA: YdcH family protein [Sphingomicrobium sp.]
MTNDDQPAPSLEVLKAEHRALDERIRALSAEPIGDQLEIARLKRRKLMLKDRIQRIIDSNIPDIIA